MVMGGLAGVAGQVTLYSGAVLAAAGVVTLIWKGGRSVLQVGRRVVHLVDDLLGEPAHGDQPERPGLMTRMAQVEVKAARIEAELRPNSGSSMRDAIDRVERRQIRTEERLDEHLVAHGKARERE